MAQRKNTLRDVFAARAHGGALLTILRKIGGKAPAPVQNALGHVEDLFFAYTDYRAREFDRRWGTVTFERIHLHALGVDAHLGDTEGWQYGPVNEDFFREMMRELGVDLRKYDFIDVGAGKGLAVMVAADYGFARNIGVELAPELVRQADKNVAIYEARTGKKVGVEWVTEDFMKWPIPKRPQVIFLNNPFPDAIAMRAIDHIEASFRENPRRAIVLYRKPSSAVIDRLDGSPELRLHRSSPYWCAWSTVRAST